jgi:hypothetical protein
LGGLLLAVGFRGSVILREEHGLAGAFESHQPPGDHSCRMRLGGQGAIMARNIGLVAVIPIPALQLRVFPRVPPKRGESLVRQQGGFRLGSSWRLDRPRHDAFSGAIFSWSDGKFSQLDRLH